MALGSKLWFDFSKAELFEKSGDGLVKELERKGAFSIAPSSSSASLLPLPVAQYSAEPSAWKEAEVSQWLEKIPFPQLQEPFKKEGIDGRSLQQLFRLHSKSPEFFFKSLKEEFGLEKFGERLIFAHELDRLFG